jgi:hypothetical protein
MPESKSKTKSLRSLSCSPHRCSSALSFEEKHSKNFMEISSLAKPLFQPFMSFHFPPIPDGSSLISKPNSQSDLVPTPRRAPLPFTFASRKPISPPFRAPPRHPDIYIKYFLDYFNRLIIKTSWVILNNFRENFSWISSMKSGKHIFNMLKKAFSGKSQNHRQRKILPAGVLSE